MLEQINILGAIYTIKYVDYISKEELKIGEVDYINQEIKIMNDLSNDIKNVTLWHEIIHAILNQLGFEDSENEHLVQSLATGIHQVISDNSI